MWKLVQLPIHTFPRKISVYLCIMLGRLVPVLKSVVSVIYCFLNARHALLATDHATHATTSPRARRPFDDCFVFLQYCGNDFGRDGLLGQNAGLIDYLLYKASIYLRPQCSGE